MKLKQARNSKGQFLNRISLLGCMIYASARDSQGIGGVKYGTGYYIVTGGKPNGVISAAPVTDAPTKAHMQTFDLGRGPWAFSVVNKGNSQSLIQRAALLRAGILNDCGRNPAYYDVARNTATQIELAAELLRDE